MAYVVSNRNESRTYCLGDQAMLCSGRYLIENFFYELKQYQAIATHYEKIVTNKK